MARSSLLPGGLLGLLLLAGGLAAMASSRSADHGPVYSVAALRSHLAEEPQTWVGRRAAVRGIAVGSSCKTWPSPAHTPCQGWPPSILLDPSQLIRLPLTLGAPNPPLALHRRLPLAGQLVPPPQVVHWGAVATYRVQLRAAPASPCASPPCYQALLLDAAPEAFGEG
jgi:hypothetical protein